MPRSVLLKNRVNRVFVQSRLLYEPALPVFLLESDREIAELFADVFRSFKIPFHVFHDPDEAFQLLDREHFSIFVVRSALNLSDGKSFLKALHENHPEALVIVRISEPDPVLILDVMRHGAFSCIMNPVGEGDFQSLLLEALEAHHWKENEETLKKEASRYLRNQLEWLTYKEERRRMGQDSEGKLAIERLRESLLQGGGFGTLISLVDMIKSFAEPHPGSSGDSVVVPVDLLEEIYRNVDSARKALNGIDEFVKLIGSEIVRKPVPFLEILKIIENIARTLPAKMKDPELRIVVPPFAREFTVLVDLYLLQDALLELVLNAVKYGKSGVPVEIIPGNSEGYVSLSVKNVVELEPYGGIPEEEEKRVVEPFYRIHPPVERALEVEKYSLGLGLTAVNYIVTRHNGLFLIHDAQDHTGAVVAPCVLAQIYLPVVDEGEGG